MAAVSSDSGGNSFAPRLGLERGVAMKGGQNLLREQLQAPLTEMVWHRGGQELRGGVAQAGQAAHVTELFPNLRRRPDHLQVLEEINRRLFLLGRTPFRGSRRHPSPALIPLY